MTNFQSIAGAAMWALLSGLLAFAALSPVSVEPAPQMLIAAIDSAAAPIA